MRLLDQWLSEISPSQRILDLGCGAGSLPLQLKGRNVFGVDVDAGALARNPGSCAFAIGDCMPFGDSSFDLVICHHTLEHFDHPAETMGEIKRVLKDDGRLFVSVPDGRSFSDRLYRLLLCGGGHVQQFAFKSIVGEVESNTGLHLAGWKELSSSFIFVDRRNFLASPRGPLPGPLPRRMRWLSVMPGWCFSFARVALNVVSRAIDKCCATKISRYGWELVFGPENVSPVEESGTTKVCMSCGAGLDEVKRIAIIAYRCPYCLTLNYG